MNFSKASDFASADRKFAERLEIARRLYQALVAQDPARLIVLSDAHGKVVARHDPQREESDPGLAS
jgi:hypothetical protein